MAGNKCLSSSSELVKILTTIINTALQRVNWLIVHVLCCISVEYGANDCSARCSVFMLWCNVACRNFGDGPDTEHARNDKHVCWWIYGIDSRQHDTRFDKTATVLHVDWKGHDDDEPVVQCQHLLHLNLVMI